MIESKNEWLHKMTEMHGLDAEDIIEIAELFFDTIDDSINQIIQAHTSGERETLVRLAHGIKGAAANIGFDEISAVARTVEAQGERAGGGAMLTDLDNLSTLIRERRQVIDDGVCA